MSNIKVKLDSVGVKSEILQADWMLNYVEGIAQRECSGDEHVKPFIGFDRAKAIIYPNRKGKE